MDWKSERVSGSDLDPRTVAELYRSSGLSDRRPVDDSERFQTMIREANLIMACYNDGHLIGIARSISDFSYVTYLSDIAVKLEYQRSGVGKALIRDTQQEAPEAKVVLLSAPAAAEYYPKIGFAAHDSAWVLSPDTLI